MRRPSHRIPWSFSCYGGERFRRHMCFIVFLWWLMGNGATGWNFLNCMHIIMRCLHLEIIILSRKREEGEKDNKRDRERKILRG